MVVGVESETWANCLWVPESDGPSVQRAFLAGEKMFIGWESGPMRYGLTKL